MIVLLTRPVRSASSARLSAASPCRKAVSTANARSADGTPLADEAVPQLFWTRHIPTTPAIGLCGPLVDEVLRSYRARPGVQAVHAALYTEKCDAVSILIVS